ncbi:MAG: hypothetical protein ACE149_19200 [Armatimonadota bacterium]
MAPVRFRLVLALALCLPMGAIAPAATAQDGAARLALIDGQTVGGWVAVESSLVPDSMEGVSALLFTVPVDWKTGEPGYPIGWPRIQMSVLPGQGDWGGWEQLRLRIYALTDADPLPYRPVGVTISGEERGSSWERDVEGLRPGRWQEFAFDLSEVPALDRVRSVGIFISEDAYRDGERLRFYIAKLELVRYRRPTMVEMRPLASPAFADARALPVEVTMLGLPESGSAPVSLRLLRGGRVVARSEGSAERGATQLSLALPKGLAPGEYVLTASCEGGELTRGVTLVASPWEERAR